MLLYRKEVRYVELICGQDDEEYEDEEERQYYEEWLAEQEEMREWNRVYNNG